MNIMDYRNDNVWVMQGDVLIQGGMMDGEKVWKLIYNRVDL